jgi:hypothetical protein
VFYPKGGGGRFFHINGAVPPNYLASHPRRTLIMKFYFISNDFKLKIRDDYRLLFTDTILNENMNVMFMFPKFTFFHLEL